VGYFLVEYKPRKKHQHNAQDSRQQQRGQKTTLALPALFFAPRQ
jgi:hypothetical protein